MGGERAYRKSEGGQICWKYYVLMYENGKMWPVETILNRGGWGIRENDGVGEFNKIYYKHFCKCHSVPPVQQ
jgi:hypothetical protein